MRELPEPEGQLAWQTYTRDQVLAIQKQAYGDGLRDATQAQVADALEAIACEPPINGNIYAEARVLWKASTIRAMLTASQKEQQ